MKYIKYKLLKYLLKNTNIYFPSYEDWVITAIVNKNGSISIEFDTAGDI